MNQKFDFEEAFNEFLHQVARIKNFFSQFNKIFSVFNCFQQFPR